MIVLNQALIHIVHLFLRPPKTLNNLSSWHILEARRSKYYFTRCGIWKNKEILQFAQGHKVTRERKLKSRSSDPWPNTYLRYEWLPLIKLTLGKLFEE